MMKLYVWRGVLRSFTSGVVVAMAETAEQARQLALDQAEPWERDTMARDIAREPDEVYDRPAAVHIWGGD